MIVDARVILSVFFPDEDQAQARALIRDHVMGREESIAPTLLLYDLTNPVVQMRMNVVDSGGIPVALRDHSTPGQLAECLPK